MSTIKVNQVQIGQSGGTLVKVLSITPGSNISYAVGAGGAAATATSIPVGGNAGGDSTFATLTAPKRWA